MNNNKGPRVLVLDIETTPMEVYAWGTFEQNIALNQIKEDWSLLSWAAKWYEDENGNVYGPTNKLMYADTRKAKNPRNDKKILKAVWDLLDSADIVLGQNSKRFDVKKLNARFVLNGMKPPSSFKQIDTLSIAKKNFALTSNKLEFTSEKLNTKYRKLAHGKFPGFKLWTECLNRNQAAFKELEVYNKHDVLATEEYFQKIQAWDNTTINFNVYHSDTHTVCKCGSDQLNRNGYAYTTSGKYVRYKCKACGSESRDKKNLLDKDKRSMLKVNVTR